MSERRLGALFFDGFELLDMFGPLEMLGVLENHFEIVCIAERGRSAASRQGPRVDVDVGFDDAPALELLLVPGGMGTRNEVDNPRLIEFVRGKAGEVEILASVCTGAALLARAGVLDGKRATTNKRSFEWVASQGPNVSWVPEARWVEDGDVFTAAGVAAGIDMSLAVIARLHGQELAERVAAGTEYDWHRDAGWDPFARLAGLVE